VFLKKQNRYTFQVVKVADFGVARVKDQSGVMTAETGTYRWMAPEVHCTIMLMYNSIENNVLFVYFNIDVLFFTSGHRTQAL
jgi:hypothetical protein